MELIIYWNAGCYSSHYVPPSQVEKVILVMYEAGGVIQSFFPIYTVLDLHNCCRLISGVHHPAIKEVMM